MELRQLRYFLAVADAGSISEAARRLGVSQPTVSDRVLALEDRMQTNLFERQSRGVRLTCAGREVLGLARRITKDVDLALAYTERVARVEIGALALGFSISLASGRLRETLGVFRRLAPDVTMALREGNPSDLLARLRDYEIDLAVTVLDVSGGLLETQKLWDEPLVVALPVDHPLAGQPNVVWADLRGQSFVMRTPAGGIASTDSLLDRIADNNHFTIERHCISRDALLGLVGLGSGITVMESSVLGLAMPDVVLKPMSGPDSTLAVTAIWLAGNDNPARGRFVTMLRDWRRSPISRCRPDLCGTWQTGCRTSLKEPAAVLQTPCPLP